MTIITQLCSLLTVHIVRGALISSYYTKFNGLNDKSRVPTKQRCFPQSLIFYLFYLFSFSGRGCSEQRICLPTQQGASFCHNPRKNLHRIFLIGSRNVDCQYNGRGSPLGKKTIEENKCLKAVMIILLRSCLSGTTLEAIEIAHQQ